MSYSRITAESLETRWKPARRGWSCFTTRRSRPSAANMATAAGDIEGRCRATARTEIVALPLHDARSGPRRRDRGEPVLVYAHVLPSCRVVNLQNDAEAAEHVIAILEPLRDSWATLDERTPWIAAAIPASMAEAQLMRGR